MPGTFSGPQSSWASSEFWMRLRHQTVETCVCDSRSDSPRPSGTSPLLVPERLGRTRNDLTYAPVVLWSDSVVG